MTNPAPLIPSIRAKLVLAAGIIFGAFCIILTIIAIVRYEKPGPEVDYNALVLCLTDDPPTDHMRQAVNKLEDRWKGAVKVEIKQMGIPCEAELRFSEEMSPITGDNYAPGVAVRECPSCMPYAMIYRDGWEGGIAGAGRFVLDHEVGHLLCLEHWPEGSAAVMRPSIWGGSIVDSAPKPSMITPDVLAAAKILRAEGCIGPVAESVR